MQRFRLQTLWLSAVAVVIVSVPLAASKLEYGQWRLFFHSTGFYSLDFRGEPFLQDPYSYLPVIDGRVEMKRDKESVHLTWTDAAPQRHVGYTSSMELLLGPKHCEMTWRANSIRYPSAAELAVFLPEAFFRSRGKEAIARYVQRNRQEGSAALTDGEGIGGAGSGLMQLRSLTLTGDRRIVSVDMSSGAELGYGWWFQDYRRSPNAPGCYRLVFSWDGSPLKAPALTLRFALVEKQRNPQGQV